jgi:hypothetical protein
VRAASSISAAIEPRAMFWCVMDFEATKEASCFFWLKGFIEGGGLVGVEVIAHQNDLFRVGVLFVQQMLYRSAPSRSWCDVRALKRCEFLLLAR